jgi:hypothetical protein
MTRQALQRVLIFEIDLVRRKHLSNQGSIAEVGNPYLLMSFTAEAEWRSEAREGSSTQN